MKNERFPTFFVPHGGGPCFFMDWNPPDTWHRMEAWLRDLVMHAGAKPKALLVISAHWEAPKFTVNQAVQPSLLFDYHGFPEHTYRLQWPAPGAPDLAQQVRDLLDGAGLAHDAEDRRGLDHGVFIPMKVAFPEADVPVVQLSLRQDLDPAAHIAVGRALAPLRDQGVLIVGSGMSFHNMGRFRFAGGAADPDSVRFDDWLVEAALETGDRRAARLAAWADAPGGRASHPREEHLLPLHVAAGAAYDEAGAAIYRDRVMASAQSGFRFGTPIGG